MDWNLRTCARAGHVTYLPDEPELAERLSTQTPAGESWRCLRCGDFVVGAPAGRGPADQAPLVPRGRLLRDRFVLRFLAIERLIRGLVFVGLGYAVLRFENSQASLRDELNRALPSLREVANTFGYDLDHSSIFSKIENSLSANHHTLALIVLFLFGYAAIEIVEAVGLWLGQRWGEYFAVIATSVFLPLEVYELTERVTLTRLGAFVLNVAAVIYLLLSKRLFGLRGGGAAYERERESESLLEVERAAGEPPEQPPRRAAQADAGAAAEHAAEHAAGPAPG